jgi:anti-sigma factor RsiW
MGRSGIIEAREYPRGKGRPTGVLTCYLTRRRIGAHLDGGLDPATTRSTAAHLASCGSCQREADELRRLRGLMRGALSPTEPDWTGFWQGIVRGIEDRREAPQPVRAERRWWQPAWRPRWALGGALAAALLMSIGVWQWAPAPRLEAGVLVTSASTEDPRGTVMVYSTPEQDVAVVWVFGLDKD